MKHKCKDCIHCDEINLICRPESKDCRKEYTLEKEDLERLERCDFFCKKMDVVQAIGRRE